MILLVSREWKAKNIKAAADQLGVEPSQVIHLRLAAQRYGAQSALASFAESLFEQIDDEGRPRFPILAFARGEADLIVDCVLEEAQRRDWPIRWVDLVAPDLDAME